MLGRVIASALAFTGAAYAQEVAPLPDGGAAAAACAENCQPADEDGDTIAYEPSYFAQFNPQNAMDMVRQAPGFSIDEGDGRRGFSGAVGNVLIDGLRPSTKSQSLSGILSRIPADQVVRIELLRGAAVAGDASGEAVLVNVVRTPSAGGGLWKLGAEYGSRPILGPRGEVSYSGRNGQFEYGAGLSVYSNFGANTERRSAFDASGAPTLNADARFPRDSHEWTINGDAASTLWGGRLGATTQFGQWQGHNANTYMFTTPAGAPFSSLGTRRAEENDRFELGLNYDRAFGPWQLELIGLINRKAYESAETATARDSLGAVTLVTTQAFERDTGESILRGAISRTLGDQHVELGAEGAFNSLEQAFALAQDAGAGFASLAIPNSNVLVEEERAEFFGSHTWRPTDRWSIETRLAWETSTLTFTGDADQSTDLAYFKPSLQITRSIGDANQLRLRIYRDVGQLNFDDFVSAVSISDNLIDGGNPDLKPETSWRAELSADLRFSGGATLTLTLLHQRITDVADSVLITLPGANPGDPPILFDAPGNIGDGELTRFDFSAEVPIGFLLSGARVTLDGFLRHSEVTDPVTGLPRDIAGREEVSLNLGFRQDVSSLRLAWGFNIYTNGQESFWRFNEVSTNEDGAWIEAFVERSFGQDMRLRLSAQNIGDRSSDRERTFFTPDRAGAVSGREVRENQWDRAPSINLELRGSF